MKLIDGFEGKRYKKGEDIVKKGEEGDYFYIVEEVSLILHFKPILIRAK